MQKPKARLTDILSLKPGSDGGPQTVLFLDRLNQVPKAGDVLHIAGKNYEIYQVDQQRTRECLTGLRLVGLGSIAILVKEELEDVKPLALHPNRLWVTWTTRDELPWHFTTDDLPRFIRLNDDWNAEPNAPNLRLEHRGQDLLARVKPNPYLRRKSKNASGITLTFVNCAKYRVTPVNDEGWYRGQCRFSGLAPSWGEFYEITGNTRDEMDATLWQEMTGTGACHFHFYLRDETLEVKAQDWSMTLET